MALTQIARDKIKYFVRDAKKLLIDDVNDQLKQFYGFRQNGTTVILEELTSTEADVIYVARTLRQRLDHIYAQLPPSRFKNLQAVMQLSREQAFTVLNRMASLRMAEERGVFDYKSISGRYESDGFQIFDTITGQGQLADTYTRYCWYLRALFDELATDLPAVFDRFSPYGLVFPQESTLTKLLALLNSEDLSAHVEEGLPTINLWEQDETLGWLYQYYNSRDEISALREQAATPRNSQELAIRNQFFTPRYVVQFLLDNTLGRLWYDMTGGHTALTQTCAYLFTGDIDSDTKRPTLKDPTELKVLDPACGSMHFGLYAFDLLEQIYREAWHNHPGLLTEYRNQYYTNEEFYALIPGLILTHNVYGVDIDPRALQMAGLSLWLRAQRTYQELSLTAANRPAINRANLVLAEPMPGSSGSNETELLNDLLIQIDHEPTRRLIHAIYDQMRIAGEAGLLLRMEQVVNDELDQLKREWNDMLKKAQTEVGEDSEDYVQKAKIAKQFGDAVGRQRFFENAETLVREALIALTQTAAHRDAYRQLLFADDSARGLAFVDLCRLRYDVIVMNPPFGAASVGAAPYIDRQYPRSKNDLAAVFIERMHEMLAPGGRLGALSTRTIFFLGTYEKFRQNLLITRPSLRLFADLGEGVLDAAVETAAYVLTRENDIKPAHFVRATKAAPDVKGMAIQKCLQDVNHSNHFKHCPERFAAITNSPLCYWADNATIRLFEESQSFDNNGRTAKQGLATSDNFRFVANYWEAQANKIGKSWPGFLMADQSMRFFNNNITVIKYEHKGREVKALAEKLYKVHSRTVKSESYYFQLGISWAYRTANFQAHLVQKGIIFSHTRFLATLNNPMEIAVTTGLWNSEYYDYLLKLSMEWITRPKFQVGVVAQLPYPDLPQALQNNLANEARQQHGWIERVFQREETSLYNQGPSINAGQSLRESISTYLNELGTLKQHHLTSLSRINEWVYAHFGITAEEQAQIQDILNVENARPEGSVFDMSERELAEGVFSWLVGVVFGRWDIRFVLQPDLLPRKTDLFSALPPCSPATLVGTDGLPAASEEFVVVEEWLKANDTIEGRYTSEQRTHPLRSQSTPDSHALSLIRSFTLWGGIGIQDARLPTLDLMSRVRSVLRFVWGAEADRTERDLADLLNVESLDEYLSAPTGFFARHLAQYTQNKRTAPIYWPLTSPGGRLTVWVYYPRLSNQTLYRIVNEVVQPRQRQAEADIQPLATNSDLDVIGRKRLTDAREALADLQDMETELLRVARFYRPNHDDGVLLSAAPLHRLFKAAKWRKITEEAWIKLEAGDYDWAHVALAIWPARVREKCRTDLSMAIAHGLESICEVKPKEKRAKASPKMGRKGKGGQLAIEG